MCAIRNRIFSDRIIDANCFLIGIFHVIEGNVKCTFYNFRYAQPILIYPTVVCDSGVYILLHLMCTVMIMF